MAAVAVLIIGALMIYMAATGRAEELWKAITKEKDK